MTGSVSEVFSARGTIGRYLRVEAAIAMAQAEVGLIPIEAARVIEREAVAENFDCDEIVRKGALTGYAVAPLVRELTARCGDAGLFVHWGATTQDVVCTSLALQINEAMRLTRTRLLRIAELLKQVTVEHRETLMVARTFGTHAAPTTFGFKSAVWLSAVVRRLTGLDAWLSEPLQGEFGGVSGTLASQGTRGLDVRRCMMHRLGLAEPVITWAPFHDRVLDSAMCVASAAACAGKIAQDIAELSMTELQETSEPTSGGRDASSTLPFKANPIYCAHVTNAATRVAQAVGVLFVAFRQRQERSAEGILEVEVLPEVFVQGDRCMANLETVLAGLAVHADRMRSNLEQTGGILLAERYMMALAPHMGRLTAHDLIHDACLEAVRTQRGLADVLLNRQAVRRHLSEPELRALSDPTGYLGSSAALIDSVLKHASRVTGDGVQE